MVKALITALCSLAIIIGASFLEQYYLNSTFSEFERATYITYEKTENHTAVKDDVLSIQNLWVEKKKSLHIFIPHNDIREIDLWIAEAVSLVEKDNFEDALSKIEVVIELVEQIPKTYKLKVENIL